MKVKLNILVACEFTDTVGKAFREIGHNVLTCDLLPSEGPGPHYQGDVRDILYQDWDMIIAFPPCTHLSIAGARYWKEKQKDGRQQAAIDFFMLFANHPCARIAIENPRGIISSVWRKPDQIVQPYYHGENIMKTICLWLKGLPPIMSTRIMADCGPIYIQKNGKKRGGAFVMLEPGGKNQAKNRSRFFPGVAAAMAKQWG